MKQSIAYVTLLVSDYDEAIRFYTNKLKFTLVEDTPMPEQKKRWVVVALPGSTETKILLARADGTKQKTILGNQAGVSASFCKRIISEEIITRCGLMELPL